MLRDTRGNVSFLLGKPGTLAVLAACRARRGMKKSAEIAATSLLNLVPWTRDVDEGGLELFQGRCGYLQAVLFLKARGFKEADYESSDYAREEIGAVIRELKERLHNSDPIEYHGTCYLGAAHGYAGIALVAASLGDDSLREAAKQLNDTTKKFVYPESRNVPSSVKKTSKDRLVHWCHGAPGWVAPRLAVGDLEGAIEAGEVTWVRGLLKTKGPGLCHGIPGNGAAFLALYRATKSKKYLHRALHFAKFAIDNYHNLINLADRPFSLFEGIAGTLCFVADCLDALKWARGGTATEHFNGFLATPAPFFFHPESQAQE